MSSRRETLDRQRHDRRLDNVWARDEGGRFGGFVLEDPAQLPGFTAKAMGGKIAKRAVHQAEIRLEEVHVPAPTGSSIATAFAI